MLFRLPSGRSLNSESIHGQDFFADPAHHLKALNGSKNNFAEPNNLHSVSNSQHLIIVKKKYVLGAEAIFVACSSGDIKSKQKNQIKSEIFYGNCLRQLMYFASCH